MTHGELFRVAVVSCDGKKCAVTVQVDTHRKIPSKAAINDVADRLRIPRDQIDDALSGWTTERFVEHLSSLTHAQIRARDPFVRVAGAPAPRA